MTRETHGPLREAHFAAPTTIPKGGAAGRVKDVAEAGAREAHVDHQVVHRQVRDDGQQRIHRQAKDGRHGNVVRGLVSGIRTALKGSRVSGRCPQGSLAWHWRKGLFDARGWPSGPPRSRRASPPSGVHVLLLLLLGVVVVVVATTAKRHG